MVRRGRSTGWSSPLYSTIPTQTHTLFTANKKTQIDTGDIGMPIYLAPSISQLTRRRLVKPQSNHLAVTPLLHQHLSLSKYRR